MKYLPKCIFFLFAGVIALGISTAQAETLQDAIKHVIKTNPDIRASAYNRLARNHEVKQAESRYYPSLDVSAGIGINDQDHPLSRTLYPASATLSLRYNIFNFCTTTNEVRRQKARVKSQAFRLQSESEFLALETARVYLNLLRQEELYELAKENLVNHQRIYDQMKLRSESGVERKADLDQVMGRLALAQSNIVVTQANVIDAKTDYQALVGAYPLDLVKPAPVDSQVPLSMEDAIAVASANYPLLKSARADIEARKYQHKSAKSSSLPSIDLTADYTWEDDVDFKGYNEELTSAAIVSYNLFDGWYDRNRIAETALQVNEAEEILRGTERQTVQSVRLSYEAYTAAKDKVIHLKDYVESAKLTVDAFSKQWMVGRRTMFDVLDTQAEYINAKSDMVNADYDMLFAQYRVLGGMGKLVHILGLEWPEESAVDAPTAYETGDIICPLCR